MAIINNGPLTNGIRGKVGDVIFQMVNGVQIVRAMPASIHDPHTPAQQAQRDAFAQAVIEWRALNVEERALWDFWAYLRSNKVVRRAQRRVDGCPKPENGTNFDGHGGAVRKKSQLRDWAHHPADEELPPIDLPSPPSFGLTKNLPPVLKQVLLAKGSLGAAWNPDPTVNYDGLWWYAYDHIPPTPDSKVRVWAQPPYPIHSQRIMISDSRVSDIWDGILGVVGHDWYLWAWELRVGKHGIRIITPKSGSGPWTLTTPLVWKFQMDTMDKAAESTKGSAVTRVYLPEGIEDGLWQVWPTLVDLTPAPP